MPPKGLDKAGAKSAVDKLRNLNPGGGGRGGRSRKLLVIEVEPGSFRDNYLEKITRAVEELDENLRITNLNMMRRIGQLAERNLRQSIRRPAESGEGQDAGRKRQTKKFTFGTRPKDGGGTGAFVGVHLNDANQSGFGYPDILQADTKTNFVWRTLEFGIGPRGSGHSEGPRGDPHLPARFGFTGPNPATSKLMFLSGPAVKQGAVYVQMFKTKHRRRDTRKRSRVDPQGQAPKFFITNAIEEMIGVVPKEYERTLAKTYRKL